MINKLKNIDNKWFFTENPSWVKFFTLFVRGDLLVLLPLLAVILMTGFYSIRFMALLVGVYISIRYLGEMIYWFSHQFSDRRYRTHDFGFKNLDNHAIYIIYQTLSIAGMVFGVGVMLFALLYMK